MDILKLIGKKIRVYRKAKGLSQEALAERLNLSTNFIGLVERGQKQVTILSLSKIAEVLEVDLKIFFEDYSTSKKAPPIEAEVRDMVEAALGMKLEDIKLLRKLVVHFSKRVSK